MKRTLFILGATLAFGLGTPATQSLAAEPNPAPGTAVKHPSKAERKQADLEKYDTNKDGKLDATEREAQKADKEAQKQAALLAKYDANHNGKLDPDEEAALQADKDKAAADRAGRTKAKEKMKDPS